jgi:4-hydroxy-tetrahydrodipicolinate synthase
MTSHAPPLGVLPVLQTPFDDAGDIDGAGVRREVGWVFDCGADGVTVAMVSEVLRLDASEREELVSLVCSAADGLGPVVASVGAESTTIAVRLACHAQSAGASALMAIPPLSVALSDDRLVGYFDAILRATDLPLVVQDASAYVGGALSIGLLARLQDRHGARVCFKPEAQPAGPRLTELLAATRGGARVYDGSGGISLIDNHRRGIIGTMPSADLCWAIKRLWSHLEAGELTEAYRLSLPLVALVSMLTSLDAYVAVEKHLLVRLGVLANANRREPVGFELDDLTVSQVDRYFDSIVEAFGEPPHPA